MMKIKPLLLGAALSLAALVACAKPHDHGDVGAKGAHGLPGSFAEGAFDNDDRKHGPPPFDLSFTSNFEADARDLGDHDFHGDADTNHKIHSVLSGTTAPVPEPQTYVLVLAGLGALGLVVGRRKVNR
jgi:PEP-CTERM motif